MKFVGSIAVVAAASVVSSVAAQNATYNSTLPMVDLGYEVHQAIAYNETGQYYNFSNIRFAQAPVGKLRFNYPQLPVGRNPEIQNGSQEVICPQASPAWQLIATQFQAAFANGSLDSWNYTRANEIAMAQLTALQASGGSQLDPRTSEDCLFLDVHTPKSAFDGVRGRPASSNMTGNGTSTYKGAPVLIWIYGGGYVLGWKTLFGSPAGLMATAMRNGVSGSMNGTNSTEGMIVVAINYRLGALGWLGGPSFQGEGGISNAALYDQRLAIQWVRQNIYLFGGDPTRITLMGESAGGGSIMHQITAFGGNKGVNFEQAIVQSPGWVPISSLYAQENTTQNFYKLLNVTSLDEARQLNSSAVILANAQQVANSPYGTYTFGPVVDGIFAPAHPGLSLQNGQFAKTTKVMTGHNVYEGVLFTPSWVESEADVAAWMTSMYPQGSVVVGDYILNTMYPPIYDGSQGYTSILTRVIKMITEQIFTCNTNYLSRASNNQTYNYEFQIPPAVHGQDIPYTFYNGGPRVYAPIANTLQGYIAQFTINGDPNAPYLPAFPISGWNSSMNGLNITGVSHQPDDTANWRCKWWQKYLYT